MKVEWKFALMEHGGLYATQDYQVPIILVTGMEVMQELCAASLDTKNWVSMILWYYNDRLNSAMIHLCCYDLDMTWYRDGSIFK